MVLLLLLVAVLAMTALVRAGAAQRRAADAEREVGLLRQELLALRAALEKQLAPGPGSVPLVPLPSMLAPVATVTPDVLMLTASSQYVALLSMSSTFIAKFVTVTGLPAREKLMVTFSPSPTTLLVTC